MKLISLDGRIGKDAVVGKTQTGRQYVRFSLANTTFVNKAEKTDWYEITSFDPYVVENKVEYLKKGRYVIVHGDIRTEVNASNGHVYLNYYVTANNIDTPSFGSKRDNDETGNSTVSATQRPVVSTLTGATAEQKLITTMKENIQTTATPTPQPAYAASVTSSYGAQPAPAEYNDADDDLPF